MPDHKFEPGQLVLVRESDEKKWSLKHFSHVNEFGRCLYYTTDSNIWPMCIPFNDDTKHLQNTTQPYEPPKPPQEYEWGQKVEVRWDGRWEKGLFVEVDHRTPEPFTVLIFGHGDTDCVRPDEIRPLPDSAA